MLKVAVVCAGIFSLAACSPQMTVDSLACASDALAVQGKPIAVAKASAQDPNCQKAINDAAAAAATQNGATVTLAPVAK